MANEKKNINDNKPKFSPYWIYGILIALFLGFQLFNNSGYEEGKSTTRPNFLNIWKMVM